MQRAYNLEIHDNKENYYKTYAKTKLRVLSCETFKSEINFIVNKPKRRQCG